MTYNRNCVSLAICIAVTLFSFYFSCTHPSDPYSNPENAKTTLSITTSNNLTSETSVVDSAGKPITLNLRNLLPLLIDSIEIAIIQDTSVQWDTIVLPGKKEQIEVKHVFSREGTYTIRIITFRHGTSPYYDSCHVTILGTIQQNSQLLLTVLNSQGVLSALSVRDSVNKPLFFNISCKAPENFDSLSLQISSDELSVLDSTITAVPSDSFQIEYSFRSPGEYLIRLEGFKKGGTSLIDSCHVTIFDTIEQSTLVKLAVLNSKGVLSDSVATDSVNKSLFFTIVCKEPENFDSLSLQISSDELSVLDSIIAPVPSDSFQIEYSFSTPGEFLVKLEGFKKNGTSLIDSCIITIEDTLYEEVNHPPQITVHGYEDNARIYVDENQTLSFTLSVIDPDTQDEITLQALNLPGQDCGEASLDLTDNQFTFSPSFSCLQRDSVVYDSILFIATDNGVPSYADTFSVTIIVRNVNRPPMLEHIDNIAIIAGDSLSIELAGSDDDGDELQYIIVRTTLSPRPVITDNVVTWKSSSDNDAGYDTIVVGVFDGTDTDSQLVLVTIGNLNSPPSVSIPHLNKNDIIYLPESVSLAFTVNATDANTTDEVSLRCVGTPPCGTLSFEESSGEFLFQPDLECTSDSIVLPFLFIAEDNGEPVLTDTFAITVIVINSNRAPVLEQIGTIRGKENEPLTFTLRAYDPDGDDITFSSSLLPNGASLVDSIFTWTPSSLQSGAYSIVFRAHDSNNAVDTETVSIIIENDNRPPVLSAENYSKGERIIVWENDSLQILFSATDPDLGDNVALSVIDPLPTCSTSFNPLTGIFTVKPTYDCLSEDSTEYNIGFRAADNGTPVARDTFRITLVIKNRNRPPVFSPINSPFQVALGGTYNVSVQAIDPDGENVTLSLVTPVHGASFINANVLRWSVDRTRFRPDTSYTLTIRAEDRDSSRDTTITVFVSTHQWTLLNANTGIPSGHTPWFAALDSMHMFCAVSDNTAIDVFFSFNPAVGFSSVREIIDGPPLDILSVNAARTGMFLKYSVSRQISLIQIAPINNYELTPVASISYNSTGTGVSRSGTQIYYGNYNLDVKIYHKRGENSLESVDFPVQMYGMTKFDCGEDYTWILGDSELYYVVEGPNWSDLNKIPDLSGLTALQTDSTGGTVYAIKQGEPSVYKAKPDFSGTYEQIPLDDLIRPVDIIVLTENVGWILDDNGELWFTNNGFKRCYKESVATPVTSVIRAADGRSVFPYTIDDANEVILYKY